MRNARGERFGDVFLEPDPNWQPPEPISALVASQNEIKRLAVIQGLTDFYEDDDLLVDLASQEIKSGVRDQPLSLKETRLGVINRLEAIKSLGEYMVYAAVEGGVHKVEDRWYETACAGVIIDDQLGLAFGVDYPIPHNIAQNIEKGMDLNQAMEIETGLKEIGKAGGFNGWLTDGKLDRQQASAQAIYLALCDIKHK